MKPFKFFQKEVKGTLDLYEGETRATASLNDGQRFVQEVINYHHPRTDINADTPDGYVYRRHLYHTNRDLYDRLRHPNNEMEQYFHERGFRETPRGQFGTPERHQDILRRINEQRDLNDNPIRLFQTTTVTKVNPKWWMKIKMFFQEMKIKMYIQDNQDMFGVIFFAASVTICFGLIIGKILNAW
jgi:hypothetical protein